ncbi:hypothetical protein JW877_00250 [bacterium]|nr:hypothetical protein [bacterium]
MKKEKRLLIGSGITWLLLMGILILALSPVGVFAQMDDPATHLERELEVTDGIIERATPVIEESANEEALELLAEAVEIQGDAWELFEDENFEEARRLTFHARDLVQAALRSVSGYLPPRDSTDIERLIEEAERFLAQNEEMIDRLGPVITESGNEEAQEIFNHAVEMNNEALGAFEDEEYLLALRLARQARGLLIRAGRLVGGGHDLSEIALHKLERTDNLISEVTDIIMDSGNEAAIDLFNHGLELQENAHVLYEDGNYELCIRVTDEASVVITRAYRMVTGGRIDPERVVEILERTDALIDRMEALIMESGNEEAIGLFNDGVALQSEAHAAYEAGRYDQAARMSQEARRIVLHAVNIVDPRPEIGAEEVERALAATEAMIEEIGPAIHESGNEEAIELLEEAVEHQEIATELFEADDYEGALAETRIARQLVQRAVRLAGIVPGGTE